MGIVLGPNRYGKAENRVVRIVRDTPRHEIRDLNVSTSLRGDFAAAHTDGDQSQVLPTDTQKNTAFAYAKKHGVSSPEDYALALGGRLLEATPVATGATIAVEEYAWDRIDGRRRRPRPRVRPPRGRGAHHHRRPHARRRDGRQRAPGPGRAEVHRLGVQGLPARRVHDAARRRRPDPGDRAAGRLALRRRADASVDWNTTYDAVRALLLATFATTYSRALQETLYAMGRAVLEAHDEIAEISFAAPNKHHYLVDLSPFGLENPGEVFIAADRPYGLIEATVTREEER